MSLTLLRNTSHVSIYFDRAQHWLFVEWQGRIDLSAAQLACLELAHVCLQQPYRRALVSCEQVTGFEWGVPGWLAQEVLPYLVLAGVEQLAWVSGGSARGHDVVHDLLQRLPPLPIVRFDDLEMAVEWLQRTSPAPGAGCPARLPATETMLYQAVRLFTRRTLARMRHQLQLS